MTKSVCLYARVSTDEQETDNQILRLRDFAHARGYEVYGEYIDIRSGKDAHRPELDRMLKDAKSKKFEKVLAIKLDRLGRSVVNLRNVLEELDSYEVKIELLDQPIDTSTSMGRMIFTFLSAIAEFERELIVSRTKDGIERARREGKTIGKPKTVLSAYQIDKAKKILSDNPNISQRELAKNFEGIGRTALIGELKRLGLIEDGRKGGSERVYKEPPKKSNGRQTDIIQPIIDPCATCEHGVRLPSTINGEVVNVTIVCDCPTRDACEIVCGEKRED